MPTSFIAYLKTLLASLAAVSISITPANVASNHSQSTTTISGGTSRNWSGYETTNGTFTTVTGTWTIPQATGSGHTSMDAAWVGIGGIKSSDLIQSGTQNIVDPSGQVSTTAFYELLPASSQTLPVTVKAGDSVTVSITQQSTNQWLINFNNNSTGQNYQNTVAYTSSYSSAEWIEEAPSSGRTIVPLDNFETVQFTAANTTENGNKVTISGSNAQAITLVNNRRQVLASPSMLGNDGSSFSITRTTNTATAPITSLDRDPRGWRRRGMDIGGFTAHEIRRKYYLQPTQVATPTNTPNDITTPTEIPTVIPTVTPEPSTISSPAAMFDRRFEFHSFGFRRHF
jgi:hypothetical protein